MVLRCPYILEQAKRMPKESGVYVFGGKKNKPLYIGRATSLRRRVLSYFQRLQDSRLAEMLNLAMRIKFFKTANLLEAVILEANFIKKYWPKYNVREKDNRSFVYMVIPKEDFARPFIVRQRELRNFSGHAHIFGPYQSVSLITSALRIIRKIFPYSVCKVGGGKPCFDYQIGLCPGACAGAVSKEDYQKNIDNIVLLLKGENKKLSKKLKKENPSAIQGLKHIQDVALVSKDNFDLAPRLYRVEGYDISHFSGKETYGSMVVFINGKPDKNQYRLFKIKNAPANDDLRALEEMVVRRFNHREWRFPDLILIDGGLPQIHYISKTLEKINIRIPFVGISKFGGDKLVFPAKTKSSLRDLIGAIKPVLLRVREEAHRFAIKSSRRRRRKISQPSI